VCAHASTSVPRAPLSRVHALCSSLAGAPSSETEPESSDKHGRGGNAATKKQRAEWNRTAYKKLKLASGAARMAAAISDDGIGAVATEGDNARDGHYLLKWQGVPYTLQADRVDTEFGTLAAGELVVDGEYLSEVGRAPGWFTPSPGNTTTVLVKHVVHTGIVLLPVSAENPLPKSCDKSKATAAGACKVHTSDHEAIMCEMVRRDRLEYDSESDSESEDESDDESEAPGSGSDDE
jgi:hypothetical protein